MIRHLARDRGLAVVLVEQYYEFARDLADGIAVMARGEVALSGPPGGLDEAAVRAFLALDRDLIDRIRTAPACPRAWA